MKKCFPGGLVILLLCCFLFLSATNTSAITMTFNSYTGPVEAQYAIDGQALNSSSVTVNDEALSYVYGNEIVEEDEDIIHATYFIGSSSFSSENNLEFYATATYTDGTSESYLPNSFDFSPADDSAFVAGEAFYLGTLTFENSSWYMNDSGSAFGFSISATDANNVEHTFDGTLIHYNDYAPWIDEYSMDDWFYIAELPELGCVRIPNDTSGSVDIWAEFGSLNLISFQNPVGSIISEWINPDQPSPVPEPSTMLLLCVGMVGLVGSRRKLKK